MITGIAQYINPTAIKNIQDVDAKDSADIKAFNGSPDGPAEPIQIRKGDDWESGPSGAREYRVMGYTHYWRRPKVISKRVFASITEDFIKLMPAMEKKEVKLAGPLGEGKPEVTENLVAFNGPVNCGHPHDYELTIPWPAPNAGGVFSGMPEERIVGTWAAGDLVATRTCPGDCSYETFHFPRVYVPRKWEKPEKGLYFQCCKTAFRPYDLAVTAFLVIAKYHLGDKIIVSTDGEESHWFDAKLLCQMELGYGLEFTVRNGKVDKAGRTAKQGR